jgi:hypothetical protein
MNNKSIEFISKFITSNYNCIPNTTYNIYNIYKMADIYVSQNYDKKNGCDLLHLYNTVKHLVNRKNIVYLPPNSLNLDNYT